MPVENAESDAEIVGQWLHEAQDECGIYHVTLSGKIRRLLSERDATIRDLRAEVQERTDNYERTAIECDDLRAEVERLTKALSRIAMLSGHSQKKSIIAGEALARSPTQDHGSSVTADGVQGGEQPAPDRWLPIENAPPEHELILMYGPGWLGNVSLFTGSHASIERTGATHWMPLPHPPRQEKPVADEPVRKESLPTGSAAGETPVALFGETTTYKRSAPSAEAPAQECKCFGDSGLHASTHVPLGSDREHCDLCGYPVPTGSRDVLSAINSDAPSAEADAMARDAAAEIVRGASVMVITRGPNWEVSSNVPSTVRDYLANIIAAALLAHGRAERERAVRICKERSAWAEAKIEDTPETDLWANYSNGCDDCAELIGSLAQDTSEKTRS